MAGESVARDRAGSPLPFADPRDRSGPLDGTGPRLTGAPLRLLEYRAETRTNRQFAHWDLQRWDRVFLPEALRELADDPCLSEADAVEDDNRSAIFPTPVATLDGLPFYLSVKGVGSTVDPFSYRRLTRTLAAGLSQDPETRARLLRPRDRAPEETGGLITGELWLRGSPYGGQGIGHAETALRVSERADLTDLAGLRIAPVVKVAFLPADLERRLRTIHWYRAFPGRMVQELRLVPSNTRIFFHARTTIGNSVGEVFDRFGIDSRERAHRFESNFLRSGVALLTLFARTLARDPGTGRYTGFDLLDVWLDKDAVLAPDGHAYFVDLEGMDLITVDREAIREKIEDQIFRSLYELMFAYEQIDEERARRFGSRAGRKAHFAAVLESALAADPHVRVRTVPRQLVLEVRNPLNDLALYYEFPMVDL